MLTFLEIQRKVDQICEKIGLEKKRVWPAVQNDGAPYVLIHENKYWYISEERGEVVFEKTTKDFEELLYWIMDNFISSYSFEFEPYRVCRRVNILRDYPDDKIKIYP